MNISGKSNEHRFMKARHDRVPVLHHDSNFKFTPKVFTITPNRNLNTPKVFFVTLGILFVFDISYNHVFLVDDDAKVNKNKELRFYPNILTFLRQTTIYRAFERVRDKGLSLTSP